MAEEIVKELSKQIEESISELKDLKESLEKIKEIEPVLIQHLNDFEDVLKIVVITKETVDSWNELISEQKTMARKFINKHSKKKTTETSFEKINELLEKIQHKNNEPLFLLEIYLR